MKPAAFIMALLLASPAHAQLGGILNKAQKAKDVADKAADLNINEQEERQLGEQVSARLRETFGVYQDAAVTRYVSLVGGVVAQQSTRPKLAWTFIVLDTDAVNAFAAPGGIIHVTRGLLGLCRNEAELAGVLGHEITHVTAKHTVRAIQQGKTISMGANEAGGGSTRDAFIARIAERAYHAVLDGQFSQKDENEADQVGVRLASKLGYAPTGLVDVLKKIDARNSGRDDRNGLFASHPATKDRIDQLEKQIKTEKLPGTATVTARYAGNIKFEAKPIAEIAMKVEGAAGLAGGGSKNAKEDEKKSEEPPKKKKGGLLGKFTTSSSEEKQSSQTVASAGARGVGIPDRDAKGGPNKNPLSINVTSAELEAFRKGITA
jgi:predicted Zn-dependent protease